jgi:hypothetical protein
MKRVEPSLLLEAVQNALTQQGKSGSAIHHSRGSSFILVTRPSACALL